MDRQVYIVSACRTGIGAFRGQFSSVPAYHLGAAVIEAALKQASISPDCVSAVVMGHVLTAGLGQNPTRRAALLANVPVTVPSCTFNMACGSSLRAIYDGFMMIRSDDCDIVVAGGMENTTLTNHAAYLRDTRKLGPLEMQDCILSDGLYDSFLNANMGETAEYLALIFSVRRELQDQIACESHTKAVHATMNKYFADEITEIKISGCEPIVTDENIREDASAAALAKLEPAFSLEQGACVTAGNSAGSSDGAAAVVLCSGIEVKKRELKPLARIVAFSQVGLEPMETGLAAIEAIKKVVEKAQWTLEDVDLFEINEAFAVQTILAMEHLNIPSEKVNITGGSIALGNPLGAAGARILVTLCHNMKRVGKAKGIAAICIAGGMGLAIAIEAVV